MSMSTDMKRLWSYFLNFLGISIVCWYGYFNWDKNLLIPAIIGSFGVLVHVMAVLLFFTRLYNHYVRKGGHRD